MPTLTMRDALHDALHEEMAEWNVTLNDGLTEAKETSLIGNQPKKRRAKSK